MMILCIMLCTYSQEAHSFMIEQSKLMFSNAEVPDMSTCLEPAEPSNTKFRLKAGFIWMWVKFKEYRTDAKVTMQVSSITNRPSPIAHPHPHRPSPSPSPIPIAHPHRPSHIPIAIPSAIPIPIPGMILISDPDTRLAPSTPSTLHIHHPLHICVFVMAD